MMLLTKEIEKKIPKLYSTESIATNDKICVAKFFTPDSNWTWFVVEGERQENGDWLFFGFVNGFEPEWGYFNLRELESARGPLGLKIERDKYFIPKKFSELEEHERGI